MIGKHFIIISSWIMLMLYDVKLGYIPWVGTSYPSTLCQMLAKTNDHEDLSKFTLVVQWRHLTLIIQADCQSWGIKEVTNVIEQFSGCQNICLRVYCKPKTKGTSSLQLSFATWHWRTWTFLLENSCKTIEDNGAFKLIVLYFRCSGNNCSEIILHTWNNKIK